MLKQQPPAAVHNCLPSRVQPPAPALLLLLPHRVFLRARHLQQQEQQGHQQ
jgi:hypothetical protein